MLALHSRLRRNEEEVAAKVMDGEAIIINLANGSYYSMEKTGGAIWAMIEEGCSLEEMVAQLTRRYAVSRTQAQADVERLAAELLQEALVTLSDDATTSQPRQDLTVGPLPYEPPILNVYRDMADLLALDPPVPGFKDIQWKEPTDR